MLPYFLFKRMYLLGGLFLGINDLRVGGTGESGELF
jgi:hypothetical protein